MDHFLLIAKLQAYGFDSLSLEFMKNYLTTENRDARSETVLGYSEKLHQASRIFIDNIFSFAKNSTLCNYANDNTQFSCEKTFGQVINNLQPDFRTFKVWLYDNFLALNLKKCHFMTLGNRNNLCNFSCDDIIIKRSLSERILGLTIDPILILMITSLIYVKLQIKN